jgi:hypothetical protein
MPPTLDPPEPPDPPASDEPPALGEPLALDIPALLAAPLLPPAVEVFDGFASEQPLLMATSSKLTIGRQSVGLILIL